MSAESRSLPSADEVVDELIPRELDWRRLVTTYPWPAMFVAGLGGYVLGRQRGSVLVGALSAYAMREMTRTVGDFLGDRLGEDFDTELEVTSPSSRSDSE